MKLPIKLITAFLLSMKILLMGSPCIAQTKPQQVAGKPQPSSAPQLPVIPPDSVLFDLNLDISQQLMPLDTILAVAVRNSPDMMFEDANIEKAHYNTISTRFSFLQGVSGFYNYTYGNQTTLNTVNTDGSVLNNSLGLGYRVGLNVTLPMTEVLSKPARMKQVKADEKMAKYKRLHTEQELKNRIIAEYFNLVAAQKMLKVRQQDVESARLTVEIATVEMKRGKITPEELARNKNVLSIAESNLELSKRDFMIYFYQLEILIGTKLHTLKRPG